eukprot:s4123_g2.t1
MLENLHLPCVRHHCHEQCTAVSRSGAPVLDGRCCFFAQTLVFFSNVVLCEVEGISSLQEALSRQQKLRADGWLTRKDVAMWLGVCLSIAAISARFGRIDCQHNECE